MQKAADRFKLDGYGSALKLNKNAPSVSDFEVLLNTSLV